MAADKSSTVSNSLQNQVLSPGTISCSVCLEVVDDAGERSVAKLKCGHRFHLDCIGSAFNAKGAMQCPNCRQVERGQWLYANGCFLHQNAVGNVNFEDDSEVYAGMPYNLVYYHDERFGHTSRRPYQGSHRRGPVSNVETDRSTSSYPDSATNGRQHPRASATNFPERNHWHHQVPVTSSLSSTLMSHEGGPWNNPSRERVRLLQSDVNISQTAGVYLQSSQSMLSRVHESTNHGGNIISGLPSTSESQNHGHWMDGNVGFYPSTAGPGIVNRHLLNRGTRDRAVASIPSQRVLQDATSEQLSMQEHRTHGALGTLGQNSNSHFRGEGVGWGAGAHVGPGRRFGPYPSQGPVGASDHWWGHIPSGVSSTQNSMPHFIPSGFQEGQHYGVGGSLQRPTPHSQGYVGHHFESRYPWLPSGFP